MTENVPVCVTIQNEDILITKMETILQVGMMTLAVGFFLKGE